MAVIVMNLRNIIPELSTLPLISTLKLETWLDYVCVFRSYKNVHSKAFNAYDHLYNHLDLRYNHLPSDVFNQFTNFAGGDSEMGYFMFIDGVMATVQIMTNRLFNEVETGLIMSVGGEWTNMLSLAYNHNSCTWTVKVE